MGIFLESFPFEVPFQHSLSTLITLPEPSLASYNAFLSLPQQQENQHEHRQHS